MIYSLDDDPSVSDTRLLDVAAAAIAHARATSLHAVSARMKAPPYWPDTWPGEHYKLLAGLVAALRPKRVIEVGTFLGLSALSMLQTLESGAELVTFDLIPWRDFKDTCLRAEDFSRPGFSQRLGNLSDAATFAAHAELMAGADLVFIDGPKDGVFEDQLLGRMRGLRFRSPPIVVFDDIRLWNMLATWRSVRFPKLDLTSFGHWSGTGLVHWTG